MTVGIFLLWTTKFFLFGNFEPKEMIEAGDLIKTETSPDSFVFYAVRKESDWDPSFLYFAQRDGYNLIPDKLNISSIQKIMEKYGGKYKQFYLYIPNNIIHGDKNILSQYFDKDTSYPSDYGYLLKLDGNSATIITVMSARIVAYNFSGKDYKAGVLTKKGHKNEFYFLIDPAVANPVTVGTKLVFSKSGAASVTKVDTAQQGGRIAVFVTVDHDLDPTGDGFPNPILIQ